MNLWSSLLAVGPPFIPAIGAKPDSWVISLPDAAVAAISALSQDGLNCTGLALVQVKAQVRTGVQLAGLPLVATHAPMSWGGGASSRQQRRQPSQHSGAIRVAGHVIGANHSGAALTAGAVYSATGARANSSGVAPGQRVHAGRVGMETGRSDAGKRHPEMFTVRRAVAEVTQVLEALTALSNGVRIDVLAFLGAVVLNVVMVLSFMLCMRDIQVHAPASLQRQARIRPRLKRP